MKTMRLLRTLLLHLILLLATVVTMYPVLWVLKMALSPSQSFALTPTPWPTQVSLANFRDVLFTRDAGGQLLFMRQLLNSVVVSAAEQETVLVAEISAEAVAEARRKFPVLSDRRPASYRRPS